MTRRSLLSLILFVCLGATALAPASAGAAPADHQTSRAATRINYPGNGIEIARQSGDQSRLKGTSGSFKKFVLARLDVLFEDAGSKPRCAASPTVVVDRYHSAGFASAGEGWYGKCPGGGYAVIYEKAASGWRQILGTQEARFCQDLAWYGVPRFIGGSTCITEALKAVRYRPATSDTTSPEASARRVVSILGGNPIVPAEEVLDRLRSEQLAVLIARRATSASMRASLRATAARWPRTSAMRPTAVRHGDVQEGQVGVLHAAHGRRLRGDRALPVLSPVLAVSPAGRRRPR